jgi:RNA polymerase sigma-70 factor (ECF subfamily)
MKGDGHDRCADALRRRDPRALALFQAEYGSLLLGYLTNLLGDRASAEDVLQVTLLEVWRRGPSYDPARASLGTWALTIARSRALDQLRRRVPEPRDPEATTLLLDRRSGNGGSAGGAAGTGGPDGDGTDALLDRWRVAGLLARLPREESSLLRMRFQLGLTQREIAEQTGIPLGTVKMRMVQALGRLRDLLDAEGGDGAA